MSALERARAAKAAALAKAEALTAAVSAEGQARPITCTAYTNRGGNAASTKENQDSYFTHTIDATSLVFGVRREATRTAWPIARPFA